MGPRIDGEEAQDLYDLGGLFRPRHCGPFDEGGIGGLGFEDQPVPSGFAKVSDDPDTVAAAMANPGVVLRRAVGSNDTFSEDAELPTNLAIGNVSKKPASPSAKRRELASPVLDDKAARSTALAFEKERKRRETRHRNEEKARQKEGERRDRAIAAAQAALEEAEREHRKKVEQIAKDRATLDSRAQAEEVRWRKNKELLDDALRRARTASYLRQV